MRLLYVAVVLLAVQTKIHATSNSDDLDLTCSGDEPIEPISPTEKKNVVDTTRRSKKRGKKQDMKKKKTVVAPSEGYVEPTNINCPSLANKKIPLGSMMRCEACRTVVNTTWWLVHSDFNDPYDAIELVCPLLLDYAKYKERSNGRRYFDTSMWTNLTRRKQVERAIEDTKGTLLEKYNKDPDKATNPLKFRGEEEIMRLSCANYILRQYCFEMLEGSEEFILDCVQNRNGRGGSDSSIEECLVTGVCVVQSKDCPSDDHNRVDLIRIEHDEFLRFEAVRGVQYVADPFNEHLLQRNPYFTASSTKSEEL